MKGLEIGFFSHLGTIAFGAALIVPTTVVKVVFEYIAKKAEYWAAEE